MKKSRSYSVSTASFPTRRTSFRTNSRFVFLCTRHHFSASNWQLNIQNLQERKYFDSGDYALSKAGKASDVGVTSIGSQHPLPENIPHLTSPGPNGTNGSGNGSSGQLQAGQSGSPVKESSFLHRETSVDEQGDSPVKEEEEESVSPAPVKEGVPIRWQH